MNTLSPQHKTSNALDTEIGFKQYRQTRKFKEWCKYFFDIDSEDTFGNKTRSALKAYRLDENTKYNVASCIGYQNYIKLQNMGKFVGAMFIEKMGYSFADLMQMGIEKVKTGNFNDWAKFMKMLGYFNDEMLTAQGSLTTNLNINIEDEIMAARLQRGLKD